MTPTEASFSTIGGGWNNVIETNAVLATIPGGLYARAVNCGQLAYASGMFASGSQGNAQASDYVLRNETTSAAMTELLLDGLSERMKLPRSSTWVFEMLVVARTQDSGATAQSGGFRIRGVIENAAGTSTMYGASGEALYRYDAGWNVWAVPDDPRAALTIIVQGGATPTRWVATVRTSEVRFQE